MKYDKLLNHSRVVHVNMLGGILAIYLSIAPINYSQYRFFQVRYL